LQQQTKLSFDMQNIYITWHYTTHGIAYLKHILSSFYCGICSVTDKAIAAENISQDAMNAVFDTPSDNGFLFDKVYYLTAPQSSFDKLSSRRFYYRKNILDDAEIIRNNIQNIWHEVLDLDWLLFDDCLRRELQYVNDKYSEQYELFKSLIWRDMQHYSVQSQIDWFLNLSNAATFYEKRFEQKHFEINDLRNSQEIAEKIQQWVLQLPRLHPNARFIINVALGSNETQVVWHIFAEAGLLPPNTKLLFTYDDKSDMNERRLKRVRINEVPINLISSIKQKVTIYDSPKSEQRRLAELKFQNYIRQGFSILFLGERGTGKTHLIEMNSDKDKLIDANCASFDSDSKAESELFGYEKGAFTGADKTTDGLFQRANGKILFLDEIHHLSKLVQAKLMKALQTDEHNRFTIRKLNGKTEKVSCQVIMASNKALNELRKDLLPDFYDRVSQLIIELPPLRNTPSDRADDWKAIWKKMKFDQHPLKKVKDAPDDKELVTWMQTQPLYGNYRDLQKIAISYHTFLTFSDELKKMISQKTPFEYAKAEFEKYYSTQTNDIENHLFAEDKTPKEMLTVFRKHLAEWAIRTFGGAPAAEKHFLHLGDNTTYRTLYQWRNGK